MKRRTSITEVELSHYVVREKENPCRVNEKETSFSTFILTEPVIPTTAYDITLGSLPQE